MARGVREGDDGGLRHAFPFSVLGRASVSSRRVLTVPPSDPALALKPTKMSAR